MYQSPFYYVFDADDGDVSLTPIQTYPGGVPLITGFSYQNLAVQLNADSDFHLRRIAGVKEVCNSIVYRDSSLRPRVEVSGVSIATGTPVATSPTDLLGLALREFAVVPEIVYPANSQINFDLYAVELTSNDYTTGGSYPNFTSQIIFQGAKQFSNGYRKDTPYTYREVPFTYDYGFTISNTGRLSPAFKAFNSYTRYQVAINDYDFELLYLTITSGAVPMDGDGDFKMTLYDSSYTALSSAPVMDWFWNYNSQLYKNGGLAPSVLYPASSVIQFDVYSLLTNQAPFTAPKSFTISFVGKKRVPYKENQ